MDTPNSINTFPRSTGQGKRPLFCSKCIEVSRPSSVDSNGEYGRDPALASTIGSLFLALFTAVLFFAALSLLLFFEADAAAFFLASSMAFCLAIRSLRAASSISLLIIAITACCMRKRCFSLSLICLAIADSCPFNCATTLSCAFLSSCNTFNCSLCAESVTKRSFLLELSTSTFCVSMARDCAIAMACVSLFCL